MDKISEDKEAWSRLIMNDMLKKAGWILLDEENKKENVICEATIRSEKNTKNSDYLLIDNFNKPLAVIETKSPEVKNPLSAKSQSKDYALKIGARFIYLSNGKMHYFWDTLLGLMKDEIRTVIGKQKWWDSTICGMLQNEKYYGDALLQKTITVDFLTHKRKANKGQALQYMVNENHPPIISKEIFDKVQDEKERRALLKGNLVGDRHKYSNKYPFSGKVFCGNCGNIFKRRHWNSTNTSKKVVWQCKTYIMDGKDACNAKAVDENVLMDAFVRMFNRIYENRQNFIKTMTANIEMIILLKPDVRETEALDNRIEKLKNALKKLIRFQVNNNVDSEVYNEEYISISGELEEVRKKRLEHDKVNDLKDGLKQRFDEILQTINSRDSLLEEFDEEIFNALVEKIEIISPAHFVFELKSGLRVGEIGG